LQEQRIASCQENATLSCSNQTLSSSLHSSKEDLLKLELTRRTQLQTSQHSLATAQAHSADLQNSLQNAQNHNITLETELKHSNQIHKDYMDSFKYLEQNLDETIVKCQENQKAIEFQNSIMKNNEERYSELLEDKHSKIAALKGQNMALHGSFVELVVEKEVKIGVLSEVVGE
jgi:chromosome segregation ATPase